MKHLNIFLATVAIVSAMACASCTDYDIPNNPVPVMTMGEATDITRTSAVVHACAGTASGNRLTLEYGEKGGHFTTTEPLVPFGDSVSCTLTGLTPGTEYACRLCSYNGRTEVRSNEAWFSTLPNTKPGVSALTVLAQGPTSIIVAYTITDDGGDGILSTGCRAKNVATGEQKTFHADSGKDGWKMEMAIAGLERNTPYQLLPFALNSLGESTGATLSFTTGNSILLGEGGNLKALMQGDDNAYPTLSFSGKMQGDDFRHLRTIDVENLNLADVGIIEGGDAYVPSRYPKDDVVGYGMFAAMDIKGVVLPLTAVSVEEQALKDCASLTSVTMPANATAILPSDGCYALEEIEVPAANKHFRSIDGILYDADVTRIVWMPLGKTGEIALPATVTSIGAYAFRGCRFTEFVMGNNVKEMGQAAFYGSSVEKAVLSDALKTIPTAAFQQCASLREVHLGTATEQLGEYVFDGTPIEHLYVGATYPPVCYDNTFANGTVPIFDHCTLHVPSSSAALYRNHKHWGRFKSIEYF